MGLQAQNVHLGPAGYFRIFARAPFAQPVEITFFRGAPVQIQSLSTGDPFGDAQLTLSFPQITIFDRPGSGDLDWLVPYTDINVYWENVGSHSFSWKWEGFAIDESLSLSETDTSMTLECKGALYQLDNYLAKPFFPQQPWPYETLLRRAMDPRLHPGLRTKPLIIEWPSDWSKTVPSFTEADYLWFLKPWGVSPGDRWTGLTARATGGWDPTLTGYCQGMLSIMYDEGGTQWTVRVDKGRQPVLYLRRPPIWSDPDVLVVDLGAPGVQISLSRDFTQTANVIYGTGKDNSGVTFTGAEINNSGTFTDYQPFAASRSVYPDQANPAYNKFIMRRETQLQFPQGMDALACKELASAQLQRFADPGYTGQLILRTDPFYGPHRSTYPRMLIRGGQSILVRGIRGDTNGVLFHITSSDVNFEDGTTTLTIDSKYRDQLTVDEVRARTRDALTPLRMLQVNQLSVTVNDLLKPWSYQEGSGIFPRAAREFFLNRIPDGAAFPWESWTKKYPPSNPAYEKYYIKINPPSYATGTAKSNWATYATGTGIPLYMAQEGTIRLSQIAAYDRYGNVLKVRFHVGVYYGKGVGLMDMPRIATTTAKVRQPAGASFGVNDITPFFEGAFEKLRPDGSEYEEHTDVVAEGAGLAVGWGTYYEPAGYSPGLFSRGAPRTGMLMDETPWQFNTSTQGNFNKYDRPDTMSNPDAGMMYLLVYCDDHPAGEPVYFLGRFFRQEPGT